MNGARTSPLPLLAISTSEVKGFKACKRQWNLSSNNRRNLEAKRPDMRFWLGTGVHKCFEKYYVPDSQALVKTWDEWATAERIRLKTELGSLLTEDIVAELDETSALGRGMMEHYALWSQAPNVGERYADKRLIPVVAEYEFEVPIPGTRVNITDAEGRFYEWWLRQPEEWRASRVKYFTRDGKQFWIPGFFVGKLDGIFQEADNLANYWVMEHKTRANHLKEEMLLLDEQTTKYAWAATWCIENGLFPNIQPGSKLKGVLYNVLRKKLPREPEPLKNGGLSQNKAIDTTYDAYMAAIKANKLDPKEYEGILAILKGKGNTFFQREAIHRGAEELALAGQRLAAEFNDIQAYENEPMNVGNPRLYPTSGEDCLWRCPFRTVCQVANYSGDAAEDILSSGYVHQKSRGKVYSTPTSTPEPKKPRLFQ